MSRYLGLVLVSALCASCGNASLDVVSAAELNGRRSEKAHRASQCRLDVTTHVTAAKSVETYSTFACEGSPHETGTGMAMTLR